MDDDYITVVEVDDPTSKETNPMQQLVKRQSSVPEDSSFITVLTINNNAFLNTNNNNDDDGNEITKTKDLRNELEMNSTKDEQTTRRRRMEIGGTVVCGDNKNKTDINVEVGEKVKDDDDGGKSNSNDLEIVIVYRLPGERLGFGLKFQGGTRNTEKVQKLFIQSCAKDSPASKVATSWGLLREGDEIVSIDGIKVCAMTRIECVRGLKDNVAIKLEVRNGHGQKPQTLEEDYGEERDVGEYGVNGGSMSSMLAIINNNSSSSSNSVGNVGGNIKISSPQQPPPPPPVPPRKLVKRNSLKDTTIIENIEQQQQSQNNVNVNKPFTPPPDAEYYINLFADGQSLKTESESDDTASTISTVIDKFSLNSNYSSETDLSGFASLTNGGTDLAKVLKPFTMLEQEFKVVELTTPTTTKSSNNNNIIPGNNYENVDFKTEKVNAYENVELGGGVLNPVVGISNEEITKKTLNDDGNSAIPTPKPRQVINNSNKTLNSLTTPTNSPTIEPKKRSILPMPRKLTPMKLPIEVAPPKVPDTTPTTPTNELKTPTPVTMNPTTPPPPPPTTTTTSKEFITKIPKAIASVFSPNSQRSMERAKTESEIKLHSTQKELVTPIAIQQQTALFLEHENKFAVQRSPTTINNNQTPAKIISPQIKSRIPVVFTPTTTTTPIKKNNNNNINQTPPLSTMSTSMHASPSNIPRMLMQKQKSETDLKLGQYRNRSGRETSPILSMKPPLQRTISAESKLRSPDRTLIPIFNGSNVSSTSTESLNTNCSTSSGGSTLGSSSGRIKGPKPKPPERVQSLTKSPTQIPKLHQQPTPATSTTTTVVTTNATIGHHYAPPTQIPTMQTFKQQIPTNSIQTTTTTTKIISPTTSKLNSHPIRFKIQTYESKVQPTNDIEQAMNVNFTDVNGNDAEKMPSLFDLMQQQHQHQEEEEAQNPPPPTTTTTKLNVKDMIDDDEPMLDCETPPPMVIGKCIKLTDDSQQPTFYSSSSSDDDGEDDHDETPLHEHQTSIDDNDDEDGSKDYDCEDGEKLGPPEVINGPGPSEAYFNLYWHSNMLPTIGEVAEDELSSLEPHSLSNGPIVIVDDLSQPTKQTDVVLPATVVTEKTPSPVTTTTTKSPISTTSSTTSKLKKSQFIGVPVLPPTVPKMETVEVKEENQTNETPIATVHMDVKNSPVATESNAVNEISNTNVVVVDSTVDKTKLDNSKKIYDKKNLSPKESEISPNGHSNELETTEKIIVDENKPIDELFSPNDDTKTFTVENVEEKSQKTKMFTKTKSSKSLITEEAQVQQEEEADEDENENGATKHIKKTTTTKTKVIKTTTKTSSTSTTTSNDDLLNIEFPVDENEITKKFTNELPKELKQIISTNLNEPQTSTNETPTSIAFTLQPYVERHSPDSNNKNSNKITVMEERQFESAEHAYTQIRTRNANGEEQLQQSTETHKERAKLKKIQSTDADKTKNEIEPLTITAATAETLITELVENPQDKQSIDRGTLHLSESGTQVERNKIGELVGIVECEHQIQDSYEHLKKDLPTEKDKELTATENTEATNQLPTVLREISECLTLTKDGEKQVTKRAETSKEILTPPSPQPPAPQSKKGAKLVKKTEDEKRLEREARELIENYQKVKKEAEKLFQNDGENDDGNGFDLNDDEVDEIVVENNATPTAITTTTTNSTVKSIDDFLTTEREHALKPLEINESNSPFVKVTQQQHQQSTDELPPALPTSAMPDLLMETEPLYVLHKNIIDETTSTPKKETILNLSRKSLIDEIQPPVPQQRRGLVNNQVPTMPPTIPTPKPSKRLTAISSNDAVDHAAIAVDKHSPISATPVKPLERIIVGVEHQLETVTPNTTNDNIINSNVNCVGGTNSSNTTTTTATISTTTTNNSINSPVRRSNSLHLESINLPNVATIQNSNSKTTLTTPIQTPTIMSTSSSNDSVKSIIANNNSKPKPVIATALELLEKTNGAAEEELPVCEADENDVQRKAKMDDSGSTGSLVMQTTPHGTAPPPAYSRLPPDGHEFPPNFCEPADLGTILIKTNTTITKSTTSTNAKQLGDTLNNNNNNHNSSTTTTTTETELLMEKKQLSYMDNNGNAAKSSSDFIVEETGMPPPPLPKTVPPPPTTTPRKIFREKLIVNIEDARQASAAVDAAIDEALKTAPPATAAAKFVSLDAVPPRRSNSTQSLTSGGSSTPQAHKTEQPDFQHKRTINSSHWARKPCDWHKDEKSERSVRDKIAMFSMDDSGSSMCGSTPQLNVSSSAASSRNGSRKTLNLSSENLLDSGSSGSNANNGGYRKSSISGSVSGTKFLNPSSSASSSVSNSDGGNGGSDYFSRPSNDIFTTRALSMENLYASPSNSIVGQLQHQQQQLSKYSESMQSLDTMPSYYASLPRRHALNAHQQQQQLREIERRTSFSGGQMSEEASRKVANLLEHRRRSITKLRGLVIPERPSTLEPILDLPEIKSRDSEHTAMSDYSTDSGVASSGSGSSGGNAMPHGNSAMPPRATKRIEAALRTSVANNNNNGTASAAYRSIFSQTAAAAYVSPAARRIIEPPPLPPAKPPRTSLSAALTTVTTTMRPPALLPHDESDSDSVFSSKISSPPMSPMGVASLSHAATPPAVPEKFALTRTLSSETNTSIASSTTSTLTSGSGSQASCSSVGSTPTVDLSRRIIKTTHSNSSQANGDPTTAAAAVAAAASRKNILASAKCRSGRGESSLLRQRNQAPYHDDEDSTDGYDEEEVRRVAHKTRSRSNLINGSSNGPNTVASSVAVANKALNMPASQSATAAATTTTTTTSSTLVNYKLVSNNLATTTAVAPTTSIATASGSSLVDRVINVAAYVEVTTTASDTDDSSHKSDAASATSPSKISAIFIDEERKASFKAPQTSEVVIASKTLKPPSIANAVPVKAVIAQKAAAMPLELKAATNLKATAADPKKKSTDTNGSSELQRWMQSEVAKSSTTRGVKSSATAVKPVLAKFNNNAGGSVTSSGHSAKGVQSSSTAELRERFERSAISTVSTQPGKLSLATKGIINGSAAGGGGGGVGSSYLDRFSSLDSVASSSSGVSSSTQNVSSTHEHNEFGSFSSLGSNQSLITAQDIQQIIEEADPPLKHPEAFIVVLQRDTPETTVGITLAGGANYETKEITVNKILADSPAARDGRLRKGDRILAVNGMSMRGLTHNESVSVLKTPRPEVTLVVTRSESLVVESAPKKRHALGSLTSLLEKPSAEQPLGKKERSAYHSASRSLDIGLDSVATTNDNEIENSNGGNVANTKAGNGNNLHISRSSSSSVSSSSDISNEATNGTAPRRATTAQQTKKEDNATVSSSSTAAAAAAPQRSVIVCKDNCGLGFSLEGGFDSPLGNRPLLIRKVFYGGAAHKTGQVKPGDEILAINGLSTAKMTRIEVWNYMNQLPLGDVELVLI